MKGRDSVPNPSTRRNREHGQQSLSEQRRPQEKVRMTEKPKKKTKKTKDIVDRHCDYVEGLSDSPRDYQEAVALFMVSTLTQAKFTLMSLPDVPYSFDEESGEMLLNTCFILIGKTRVSRKTSSVDKAETAILSIAPEIKLTDEFTMETVEKTFDGRKRCVMAWIQDECLQFFTAIRYKDYMRGADSTLSKLIDGKGRSRRTSGGGKREIPRGNSIGILFASTTFLPTVFTLGSFRQGFLNRFIFVWPKLGELKPKKRKAQKQEMRKILYWLKALYEYQPRKGYSSTPVQFTSDALALLNKYDIEINKRIKEDKTDSLKTGWLGNAPSSLERLAALYRIARLKKSELKSDMIFLIAEVKDVKKAIKFMKKANRWADKVINAMELKKIDEDILRLIELITKYGEVDKTSRKVEAMMGIVNRHLGQGKTKLEVRTIVDSAIDQGIIERFNERKKGMKKSATWFRLL